MKKDLFWKIIALLFILWLFLWLGSNLYFYNSAVLKVNKITGEVYIYDSGTWIKLD